MLLGTSVECHTCPKAILCEVCPVIDGLVVDAGPSPKQSLQTSSELVLASVLSSPSDSASDQICR